MAAPTSPEYPAAPVPAWVEINPPVTCTWISRLVPATTPVEMTRFLPAGSGFPFPWPGGVPKMFKGTTALTVTDSVAHVRHRHHFAQHRVRVVLRMVRGGHLDPCELLAGGAVLVHVPHRAHRVHVDRRGAVGDLEGRVRGRSAPAHSDLRNAAPKEETVWEPLMSLI